MIFLIKRTRRLFVNPQQEKKEQNLKEKDFKVKTPFLFFGN